MIMTTLQLTNKNLKAKNRESKELKSDLVKKIYKPNYYDVYVQEIIEEVAESQSNMTQGLVTVNCNLKDIPYTSEDCIETENCVNLKDNLNFIGVKRKIRRNVYKDDGIITMFNEGTPTDNLNRDVKRKKIERPMCDKDDENFTKNNEGTREGHLNSSVKQKEVGKILHGNGKIIKIEIDDEETIEGQLNSNVKRKKIETPICDNDDENFTKNIEGTCEDHLNSTVKQKDVKQILHGNDEIIKIEIDGDETIKSQLNSSAKRKKIERNLCTDDIVKVKIDEETYDNQYSPSVTQKRKEGILYKNNLDIKVELDDEEIPEDRLNSSVKNRKIERPLCTVDIVKVEMDDGESREDHLNSSVKQRKIEGAAYKDDYIKVEIDDDEVLEDSTSSVKQKQKEGTFHEDDTIKTEIDDEESRNIEHMIDKCIKPEMNYIIDNRNVRDMETYKENLELKMEHLKEELIEELFVDIPCCSDEMDEAQEELGYECVSYKCTICYESFSDEDLYNEHMEKHIGIDPLRDKRKPSAGFILRYAVPYKKNNIEITDNTHTSKTELADTIGGNKNRDIPTNGYHKRKYKNKWDIESDSDVWEPKKYKKNMSMDRRKIPNIDDTVSKPFSCDHCNYKTSMSRYLDRHVKSHTNSKRFSCELCRYECTKRDQLDTHIRIHTGFKPFSCNLCEYKCVQRSHLDQHLRIHTGSRPYSCNFCDYKCKQRSHLNQHIRTHTGLKPFLCDMCGYRFSQKSHVNAHMAKIHGSVVY